MGRTTLNVGDTIPGDRAQTELERKRKKPVRCWHSLCSWWRTFLCTVASVIVLCTRTWGQVMGGRGWASWNQEPNKWFLPSIFCVGRLIIATEEQSVHCLWGKDLCICLICILSSNADKGNSVLKRNKNCSEVSRKRKSCSRKQTDQLHQTCKFPFSRPQPPWPYVHTSRPAEAHGVRRAH